MSTTMNRLQLSLPPWQVQFLTERARREGVSMAEIVRRLITHEATTAGATATTESVLSLAGLAEDLGPLTDGIPVSEAPERYLEPDTGEELASEVAEPSPSGPLTGQ